MKRLAEIAKGIGEKLQKEAKRYNKRYPDEILRIDGKRLPFWDGHAQVLSREYLCEFFGSTLILVDKC